MQNTAPGSVNHPQPHCLSNVQFSGLFVAETSVVTEISHLKFLANIFET
uniref:Uncharacterized protein n=1 Tax=Anguilla anguilla TaxID=7936 RepID=A0A0E9PCZ4_ANGAN